MTGGFDLAALSAILSREHCAVRVLVVTAEGSTPREPGASMLVWEGGSQGTIGGGALELEGLIRARDLIGTGGRWRRSVLRLALGPALGQCCGGAVTLLFERFTGAERGMLDTLAERRATMIARPMAGGEPPFSGVAPPSAPLGIKRLMRADRAGEVDRDLHVEEGWVAEPFARPPVRLFLYGAGHVGRALVPLLAGLPLHVIWVDDAKARFPETIPPHADMLVAADPADAATLAGPDALHLVMTYSHDLDLEVCHRVLSRPFAHLGLIGSETKAARFRSRLADLGHPPDDIARMQCPIGVKSLGKSPAAVALGTAADLLRRLNAMGLA